VFAELRVQAIRTEIFRKGQNLSQFVIRHLKTHDLENKILILTSKVVSLAESHFASQTTDKEKLIRSEADVYLGEMGYGCHLTIKHHLLMMTAGVDLSNSETNDYILLPTNPFESARNLHVQLKKEFHLKNFGVLISDSRTLPIRPGVIGCGLSCFGFLPIQNKVGKLDLFGRKLKMTQLNLIDAIATSAVMMMGESDEQTPLALVSGAPVEFSEQTKASDLAFEISEDLYYPLYQDLIAKNDSQKKENE
jgi:F420-0:gamma-glutamyl ligase